jgi:hypothetical protein
VAAVIGARQKLHDLDNTWLERRKTKLMNEFTSSDNVDSESFQTRLESELRLPFFSFSTTQARNEFKDKFFEFKSDPHEAGASARALTSPGGQSSATIGVSPSTLGYGRQPGFFSLTQDSIESS